MKDNSYKYSVLKYQHSLLLGESLNIGVLIYFATKNTFIFKYAKNLSRIKSVYDGVAEKTIKHYLTEIEATVSAINEIGLFDNDKFAFFDLFIEKYLLPKDGSVLQFSKGKHCFVNDLSSDYIISSLVNKLLPIKDKNVQLNTLSKEPQLTKTFYSYLSNLDFEKINNKSEKFYKNYVVVNETGNEFYFDYAWQNGTLNLIKPISFDLKEPKSIAEKAYKNYGLFTDLKNEAEENNLRYDLLIGRPQSRDLFREYDHAVKLLSTLEKVNIVLEDQIESYSSKAVQALIA